MAQSLENKLALLEARLEEAISRGASDADLTRIRRRIDSINESIRDASKLISEQLKDFDELEGSLSSIGSLIGKNTNLYEKFDEQILAAKASLTSVSNLIETSTQLTLKQKEKAAEAANVYAKFIPSISEMVSKIKLGTGTQEQMNESVISTYKNYKLLASQIDRSTRDGAAMGAQLDAMADNMQSFYEASMKSAKQLQTMDSIMGQFSGIPAMSEFNTLLKTNKNDTLALRAALFAVGAAVGKFVFDYFGALKKIQMVAPFEAEIIQLEAQSQIREKQIELSKIDGKIRVDAARELATSNENIFKAQWEAANASKRAALEFNAQIQQSALQFRTASKTALFGDKLGGVGYGAAQMEMAGVSADRVAESIKTTGNILGKMPTSKVASDMAVMATRTGATDESLASLTHMFMDIDGLSMSTAVNMEDGLAAMAKSLNIPMDAFINEMAEASKEMLGYQIKSGPALAKQVAYAKSLGVSFSDIAKAGQNMVLNYKDSIKSEMQLSAMLGKQVDLSEVRSKFAMGDTKGALEALKAQGLNPAEMDMFQQQALQQATGMDLQTLRNIYTGEGRTANLKEGSAATNNRQFLGRVESAQREQAIGSANISANQAIFSAKLEKDITQEYYRKIINPISEADKEFRKQALELEKQKTDAEIKAIEQSAVEAVSKKLDPIIQALAAKISKVNTKMDLLSNGASAAAAVLFGIATNFLGRNLLKLPRGGSPIGQPTPSQSSILPPGYTRTANGRFRGPNGRFVSESSIPTQQATQSNGIISNIKGLFNPKTMSRGAKFGGSALAGIFSAAGAFSENQEKGGTTGESIGAGLVQGGLSAGLGTVGAAFGGPIGLAIGGFLGDTIGGWINDNAPGVAMRFGNVWESMMGKFDKLKEAFQPIINGINNFIIGIDNFMKKIGFEDGLGSVFSIVAEFIGTNLMAAFNTIISVVGFVIDIFTSLTKLLTGDFSGAWETLKGAFVDFFENIISPFEGMIYNIKRAFATVYNSIADSWVGKAIGMSKMDMPKEPESVKAEKELIAKRKVEAKAKTESAAVQSSVTTTTANRQVQPPTGLTNESIQSIASSTGMAMIEPLNSIIYDMDTKMYKPLQKQVSVLASTSARTFDRSHKTVDNLVYLNNNRMVELININKNIQTLQEANVELMALLVKHAQIPAEVTLDGKLVGKKLGDIYQSSRTIITLQ